MSGCNLKINLKPKERIFINGALIGVNRKVTLELVNEAVFILDAHVLSEDRATTPLRRLYFILQSSLMQPHAREAALRQYRAFDDTLVAACDHVVILEVLRDTRSLVEDERIFSALKRLRGAFPVEQSLFEGAGRMQAVEGCV